MHSDSAKKELDLPPGPVQGTDAHGRQGGAVVDEQQSLAGFWILVTDAKQRLWVILRGLVALQHDRLIAHDAGSRTVRRTRTATPRHYVALRARHKEAARLMKPIQAVEIDVAAVHDAEGAAFRGQVIDNVDFMQLAIADRDKARDIALQIEQRVHLHRRFGGSKPRPRKRRERQIDSGVRA